MQSRANMAVYWLGMNSHSRTTKYKAQSYPFDACDLHFFFQIEIHSMQSCTRNGVTTPQKRQKWKNTQMKADHNQPEDKNIYLF